MYKPGTGGCSGSREQGLSGKQGTGSCGASRAFGARGLPCGILLEGGGRRVCVMTIVRPTGQEEAGGHEQTGRGGALQ